MAAPQAMGPWVYAPDDVMEEYNRLYGNDAYRHILKNPALRDKWMNEQTEARTILSDIRSPRWPKAFKDDHSLNIRQDSSSPFRYTRIV